MVSDAEMKMFVGQIFEKLRNSKPITFSSLYLVADDSWWRRQLWKFVFFIHGYKENITSLRYEKEKKALDK